MNEPTEQEMRSMYAHRDLLAALRDFEFMPADWIDLETMLEAQDVLAGVIQRKQRDAA